MVDDIKRINSRLRNIEKLVNNLFEKVDDFIDSCKIPDRMIDTAEAAEYLGISIPQVRQEIKDGNLPAIKGARSYKISLRTVLERVGIDDLRAYQKKNDRT